MVIRVLSEAERTARRNTARKRMLGNIRFVGELFKMGMLTSKIMHECIRTLISNPQVSRPGRPRRVCPSLFPL